ncbi:MAG: alpha/beta hydrolase [Gammaproteobacteria bacterium]|nr:alpha/beta hydrolase [Gammaproteobacteria bacterium]
MLLSLDNTFTHKRQAIAWGRIGNGDPIVLVHGFPWSSQCWRNIAPWIAKNRTVYYFDMIGFGQSDMFDNQDVSAARQNELLTALIEYWGLDQPEILAHDFGGLAVLRGCYINGLRFRKLTLINVVAVLPSGSPFYAHVRNHEAAFAGLPAYAHDALFRAYIQRAALKTLPEDVIEMYAKPWQGESGQPAFYRQIAQSDTKHIKEVQKLYKSMDGIVNLLWAEEDTFIPIDQGRQLASIIKADSFTSIPGAAHIVQEDAPEAIVAALL